MQEHFENTELEFPLTCHFRVVAENLDNMHFVIETVLMGLGIQAPLEESNTSGQGKYISFKFSALVQNKTALDAIDRELRLIAGVKMVM